MLATDRLDLISHPLPQICSSGILTVNETIFGHSLRVRGNREAETVVSGFDLRESSSTIAHADIGTNEGAVAGLRNLTPGGIVAVRTLQRPFKVSI